MLRILNEAPTKILGQKTFLRRVLVKLKGNLREINPCGLKKQHAREVTSFWRSPIKKAAYQISVTDKLPFLITNCVR